MTITGGVPLDFTNSDLMRSIITTKGNGISGDEPPKNGKSKPILAKVGEWERMCDVKPEVIDWLFYQRIVTKGVTVFSGNGGVAKTTMALDAAARGSKGRDFCDGSKNEVGVFGTILLSDEDDASSILVPRLMAADADLSMIHRVTAVQTTKDGEPTGPRQFNLESDLDIIRQRLTEHPEIRLVVIDPVSNYLGHLELNSDQDYRAALMPAIRMAQEMNVAIVVIAHNNKQSGRTAAGKVGGATGVVNTARLAWTFLKNEQEEGRLMLPVKSNLGKFDGIRYDTEDCPVVIDGKTIGQARIKFLGSSSADADNLVAQDDDVAARIEKPAVKLIRSMMPPSSDHETEYHSDPIIKAGVDAGISTPTLHRARKALRIKTARVSHQWLWRWMADDEKDD